MSSNSSHNIGKGAISFFGGEIATQAFGFLRNIIVANALGPEHFGIATVIASTATLIEILSGLDVGRFLTRVTVSEINSNWLDVANAVAIIKGIISGIFIILSGPFIADFLDMSEHAWAFQLMAMIPIARGFTNHSIWWEQRIFVYRPFILSHLLSQFSTLVFILPLLYFYSDFRILLFASIFNCIFFVICTQLLSFNAFKLALDKSKIKDLMSYSSPLWLDGLLMFFVLQGERLLVAKEFGASMAGIYGVVFLIVWTPTAIISRVSQALCIPFLAKLKEKPDELLIEYHFVISMLMSVALCFAVFFCVSSSSIITYVFGEEYELSAGIVVLLGAHYSYRILRGAPIIVALTFGSTFKVAQANLIRVIGLLISWVVAILYRDLIFVFIVATVSEVLASLFLFITVSGKIGSSLFRFMFYTILISFVTILGLYWGEADLFRTNSDLCNIIVGGGASLLAFILSIIMLNLYDFYTFSLMKVRVLELWRFAISKRQN